MNRTTTAVLALTIAAALTPLLFARDFTSEPLLGTVADPAAPLSPSENPAVDPGRVAWHPNLETAREASVESGRPVLLFQLLGRLDQEFC